MNGSTDSRVLALTGMSPPGVASKVWRPETRRDQYARKGSSNLILSRQHLVVRAEMPLEARLEELRSFWGAWRS
jgi:hypothetical protein